MKVMYILLPDLHGVNPDDENTILSSISSDVFMLWERGWITIGPPTNADLEIRTAILNVCDAVFDTGFDVHELDIKAMSHGYVPRYDKNNIPDMFKRREARKRKRSPGGIDFMEMPI